MGEFKGEHKNDGNRFKVGEKNNMVTYLDGRPWQMSYSNNWDFMVMDGDHMMHQMDEMKAMLGIGDMPEDDMEEPMYHPWYHNGKNIMSANWKYEPMFSPILNEEIQHWKESEWTFQHLSNATGMINDFQLFGSSRMDGFVVSEPVKSAEATISYEQDSNIGWSDQGVMTVNIDNIYNCMAMIDMVMGDSEETAIEGAESSIFTMNFGDEPCMMSMEIEGESMMMDMETMEEIPYPYSHGMGFSFSSLLDMEIMMLVEDEFMSMFKVENDM